MPNREWVRSESRAENPGIRKEEDGVKIGFLGTGKMDKMGTKQSGVVQCSWLEDLQHSTKEP